MLTLLLCFASTKTSTDAHLRHMRATGIICESTKRSTPHNISVDVNTKCLTFLNNMQYAYYIVSLNPFMLRNITFVFKPRFLLVWNLVFVIHGICISIYILPSRLQHSSVTNILLCLLVCYFFTNLSVYHFRSAQKCFWG